MARPIMRRLSPLVLALVCLLALPAPTSSAQEQPSVRLTLLSQTPWNCPIATKLTPPRPAAFTCPGGREVVVRFRAENLGTESLHELAIGLTLFSRVLTRSAYESSLDSDASIVIQGETLPHEGTLEPGMPRDFEVSVTLGSGIDPDQSGVYPLKVDLRSGFASVAELRTPVVFVVREPEVPLRLSWTFVLHHSITFAPDGTFVDPSLEVALEPGGRLHGEIRALLSLATDPEATAVDVAVSPVLLTQLGRMRDGYAVSEGGAVREVPAGEGGAALAAQALSALRTIAAAPSVHVTALPFATPELPSLYGGGLGKDVDVQLDQGREVAATFLGSAPASQVLRPPGAALDDATLRNLPGSGVTTLLVGPETVPPVLQPLGFAGPATTGLGEGTLSAIVPEPATEAVLTASVGNDPVLAAQIVLGELATIWQEQPGEERGLAVVFGEDEPLPGPFFAPFASAVAGAPWLRAAGALEFVDEFPPDQTLPLAAQSFRRFSSSYVASLKLARRRIDTLASMLPSDSSAPERLDTMLLLAEARQFLAESDGGLEFISSVHRTIQDTMSALVMDTVTPISLSSDQGAIPITVSNDAEEALSFSVRLRSDNLRGEPVENLRLAPGTSETVRLHAEMRSAGRALVRVQLVAPSGRRISQETIEVRSTGYNRVALLITIGAAILIIGVWARRFLPRRTS